MYKTWARKLNDKGQCPDCKRKPLIYKRTGHKFCPRCDRQYDIETGEQTENWAYQKSSDGFTRIRK